MFIKQRQVRRPERFTSRWARASMKRRDYVATLYTTGVVQAFLFAFLLLGAQRSFVMMRSKFPDLVWYLKYSVPFFVLLISLIVLRTLVGNVRRALEAYRPPDSPSKP